MCEILSSFENRGDLPVVLSSDMWGSNCNPKTLMIHSRLQLTHSVHMDANMVWRFRCVLLCSPFVPAPRHTSGVSSSTPSAMRASRSLMARPPTRRDLGEMHFGRGRGEVSETPPLFLGRSLTPSTPPPSPSFGVQFFDLSLKVKKYISSALRRNLHTYRVASTTAIAQNRLGLISLHLPPILVHYFFTSLLGHCQMLFF